MNIKNILVSKTTLVLIVALVVGFGGTFAYLSVTDTSRNKNKNVSEKETKQDENANKQDQKGEGLPAEDTTPKTPEPVQEEAPTRSSTSLKNLNSSVTAQKSISDNSIEILFYLEGSGYFTAQEKSGSLWTTVKENKHYIGSGGFSAGTIPAGEESKIFRVLKIENGKYVAVTKEFTVSRSEVEASLGIKTYN